MSKNSKNKEQTQEESRRGAVGGQAVIEGVMMKSKDSVAIAVRRESGEIVKKLKPFKTVRDKYKILNIPVLRGFINFIEMMIMAMSTLNESAEMLGLDEDVEDGEKPETGENQNNPENPEKQKKPKTESKSMIAVASIIGTVLGLALSFGLFFFLPTFIGTKIISVTPFERGGWFISVTEGVLRLSIFIVYILLVSLIPDIKRTFQYHGAEHMSVFCYEAEKDLTVENVKNYSRFHPRCGTSFMIVMMLIGIIISTFIPDFTNEYFGFSSNAAFWLRLGVKLSVFPIVIGIGYEFIKYAGKHDSAVIKILSAPGLLTQWLTTKKPDDKQIEIAVVSLRTALKIDAVESENTEILHEISQEIIQNEH